MVLTNKYESDCATAGHPSEGWLVWWNALSFWSGWRRRRTQLPRHFERRQSIGGTGFSWHWMHRRADRVVRLRRRRRVRRIWLPRRDGVDDYSKRWNFAHRSSLLLRRVVCSTLVRLIVHRRFRLRLRVRLDRLPHVRHAQDDDAARVTRRHTNSIATFTSTATLQSTSSSGASPPNLFTNALPHRLTSVVQFHEL